MLRTVIVSPDRELSHYLHSVLADIGGVSIVRVVDRYPDTIDLSRTLRAHAPQAVFLSTQNPARALALASHIDKVMPGVQVVAVGISCEPAILMEIMRAGIREFLAAPFDHGCVKECLVRIGENLARRPIQTKASDLVYSFLPAKPGVGATTLAINASIAAARNEAGSAVLMDFDLNCGMTRFMLKLNSSYSVLDAAEHASNMDETLWPQIVTRCSGLDVVHAGVLNPEIRIQNMQIQHLLDYARHNYKVIAADLSGNLEKYSMEIMHESRKIFLVTTSELSSLHLAQEKLQYLQRMDLANKACLLLNRQVKRSSVSAAEVEQIVGAPVMMSFPNDYPRVAKAIKDGAAVETGSELGRSFADLGAQMLERTPELKVESKRRFVEYFNISPARFSLERSKS